MNTKERQENIIKNLKNLSYEDLEKLLKINYAIETRKAIIKAMEIHFPEKKGKNKNEKNNTD